MLTGQGQPEGDLPWYTKLVCCLTAFLSVPVFVIPSSMLTWGFEAEAERLVVQKHEEYKAEVKRIARGEVEPISSDSSSENEDGVRGDQAWAMYEQTIAGSDDEEDDEDEDDSGVKKAISKNVKIDCAEQHRAVRVFQAFDKSGDGSMQIRELCDGLQDQDSSELIMNLDEDESGEVTIAEWLAYLSAMRDQHGDTVVRMFLKRCEESLGLWKQNDALCQKSTRKDEQSSALRPQPQVQQTALQGDDQAVLQGLVAQMTALTAAVEKMQENVDNLTQVVNTKLNAK